MPIGPLVAHFFAGIFFCNCIPHLASGLTGQAFPTPFAKPSGVGDSSAWVNFLWGAANLLVLIVLINFFPLVAGRIMDWALFFVGFLLLGIRLSRHFAEVRLGKSGLDPRR